MNKASLIYNAKATLGEGPFWDLKSGSLYWVDIEACRLHIHGAEQNSNQFWQFDEMIGAAVPMENDKILLALEKGLAVFDPKTKDLEKLGVLENSDHNLRFNDGKCDLNGHFWIGTMHKELASNYGSLYKVNNALEVSLEIPGTTISNGMAWSSDNKQFYYIDTSMYEVWVYDFDKFSSTITNKRVCFSIPKNYGGADGMCIDREGFLWIAHWGDHCVRRWDPSSGKEAEKITVNAPHVTSCCFGGPELDTLYITTARSGLNSNMLNKYPESGGLFSYKTNVKGFAPKIFKRD